jgi:uncharacterized protein YdeI (YjbR/CyaY-like superfamily)
MIEHEQIRFRDREEFRKWLTINHEKSNGIWILFYRKHVKIENISYNEVLEEALCFGWIDSLIKKVDSDTYARKVTPRTDTKKWSEINKRKVVELIKSKKMTMAGLNKIDVYIRTGKVEWEFTKSEPKKESIVIPGFMLEEFSKHEPALTNFEKLSATFKRHYVLWITSAKKTETIKKRLKESVGLLKNNEKLGLR